MVRYQVLDVWPRRIRELADHVFEVAIFPASFVCNSLRCIQVYWIQPRVELIGPILILADQGSARITRGGSCDLGDEQMQVACMDPVRLLPKAAV